MENKSGLIVKGRDVIDNHLIGELVADKTLDFYAEWDAIEGYWFFPEEEEMYDELEQLLEDAFYVRKIYARIEGVFA